MLGCLVWWVVELSEFDIQYKPHPVIKSQALADFIVKCTILDGRTTERQEVTFEDELTSYDRPWILHVDGSSTTSMSAVGIILITLDEMVIEYVLRFAFLASNNEIEYEVKVFGVIGNINVIKKTFLNHM